MAGAANFIPVNDAAELDQLFARSQGEPVLLFKHSSTCPISGTAYREVERVAADVNLVVVQKARDVSNEIASRTGVRHESPQALLLRGGAVVWSASHWHVTAEALENVLREHGEQPQQQSHSA